MRTITKEEEKIIANEVINSENGKGKLYVLLAEDTEDDIEVLVEYEKDVQGYCEDGYHNGTGAFIPTSAYVSVDVSCQYDDINCNSSKIEEYIYNYLMGC